MSEAAILELSDLRRTFIQGEVKIDVLRGVSFRIAP
ncbi:MAG: lipoprotein-releasing system ATP-binding protein LolD, partial [Rhodospirillaceae bacterium]|nr:lipoprotein-releasing system ATP-binding protein LolD [Rhodospirillaceae bacterium]